jgi:glutamate/tyrosine decarboxylase-like PLP-dependent enzyme
LAEKLELAERLRQGLSDLTPGRIEIVTAPQLTVVAFARPRLPGEVQNDCNRRNDYMLQTINAGGRSVVSSTLLAEGDGDRLVVRACVLSHRTGAAEIDALLDDVRAASKG